MAEYCVNCVNEIFETNYPEKHFILSYDYCERCGKYTKTVVVEKCYFYSRLLKNIFFPFVIFFYILKFIYLLIKHFVSFVRTLLCK